MPKNVEVALDLSKGWELDHSEEHDRKALTALNRLLVKRWISMALLMKTQKEVRGIEEKNLHCLREYLNHH